MATKIRKTDLGVEICWDYREQGPNTWESYYRKSHVDALISASGGVKNPFADLFGSDFFKKH